MNRFQIILALTLLIVLLARLCLYFYGKESYKDGEKIELTTTLLSEPVQSRFNQKIYLQTQRGQLQIILPKYPEYHYGQFVQVLGEVKLKTISALSNQSGKVINKNNTTFVIYFPKIEIKENKANWILAIASFFRQKMISLFQKTFSANFSSLMLGIVFGIKQPMNKEFTEYVRTSGVMHVVAASGMNVTMLIGFVSPVLLFLFRRRIALILIGICIVFYALVSGLQASILRASIMGIFVLLAQILGRQVIALWGLCCALFLMLIVSPQTIFDIGFQLSFLSTIGLIFIGPFFKPFAKSKSVFKRVILGDDVAATISAQLATIPIMLLNFGSYSPVSVVVNGLVLWTIPILMSIGGIGGLVGMFFEPLGKVLLYVSLPLLMYFEQVVSWFGRNFSSISIEYFPWEMGVGYYLILTAAVFYFKKK